VIQGRHAGIVGFDEGAVTAGSDPDAHS